MSNEIKAPTIHLNGSSADSLREANINVLNKLYDLIDALNAAAPNARDFYPQGGDACSRASVEHCARLDALKKLHCEINTIVEAIDYQEAVRSKRR